jgi:uncharacterized delta-60 repeat protein
LNRKRLLLVSVALAAMGVFAGSLSAAGGDLDPTFDGDGKVTLDLGSPYDSAYDVAVQRDGKILVAGETYPGAWNFALARYNRNGSPDTSFGTGGIVHTEFGWGAGVAVQSDGKIVMVGGGSLPGGTSLDFAVVRYNVDGSLDASFGAEGKAVADFGYSDSAAAVAIQHDGRIVVVGRARRIRASESDAFALARFNPDGLLDASFDGDGRVMTAFTSLADAASDVEIQRDGRILLSGYAGFSRTGHSAHTGALARYNPDGSLDTSFDGDGQLTTRADVDGSALALQPDGKILVAGASIVRLNRDGSLDSRFGQAGVVALGCMWVRAVLLQPDRKIIAAGITKQSDDFTVLRLKADGWTDSDFRAGQCNGTDFASGSRDWPYAAVLQGDRRIVVVGSTRPPASDDSAFAVARYQNPAPPSCVVPNLRGKTLRAARPWLTRANCRLGKVTRAYSRTVANGRVISQRPRPRARLPERGNVNVVVSRGRRR